MLGRSVINLSSRLSQRRLLRASISLLPSVSQRVGHKQQPQVAFVHSTPQYLSKQRKRGGAEATEDVVDSDSGSDSDSDDEADESELKTARVISYRIDNVAKVAFNLPRHKMDDILLEASLFHNSARAAKKSAPVKEGDTLDFIRGVHKDNSALRNVSRAVVTHLDHQKDRKTKTMEVRFRYWRDLILHESDLEPAK